MTVNMRSCKLLYHGPKIYVKNLLVMSITMIWPLDTLVPVQSMTVQMLEIHWCVCLWQVVATETYIAVLNVRYLQLVEKFLM